jgi:hypothetical protein
METTYNLIQRDYYESCVAHRNRSTFSKWLNRFFVGFFVVWIVLITLTVIISSTVKLLSVLPALLIPAVLITASTWGLPWLTAINQFKKAPGAQGQKTVSWDSNGIHWKWDGGSSEMEWKNFIRIIEAKNLVLLYQSPNCFNVLPKRALTNEQMADFQATVTQSGLEYKNIA